MKLLTLIVLALCVLILNLPINSNILIGAILVICVILVVASIYKAIAPPMKEHDPSDK